MPNWRFMNEHPKVGSLRHVAILGLGPSVSEFLEITKRIGGASAFCDEVWGINALGDVFKCHRVFHMDDVRIQEIRAQARPQSNIAKMLSWLKTCTIPVVTSREHVDYPALVAFPLQSMINDVPHGYYNNTAAYAVAYAILLRVKRISVFGCDYTYPNAHDAERGRACLEYWLGIARERGIEITIPKVSTLMDACYPQRERFYGYDTLDIEIKSDAGGTAVSFSERDDLPTADEIEARYSHDVHPNPLVNAA